LEEDFPRKPRHAEEDPDEPPRPEYYFLARKPDPHEVGEDDRNKEGDPFPLDKVIK
tara:strand:+ start:8857 stop:9024 length:168 start_codon:yes stop_codon:yes gene_type:complete